MTNGELAMAIELLAPMAGKVLTFLVEAGDVVEEDEPVIMLEALKMELPVVSTIDGTLKRFCVEEGQSVEADAVLAILEE